MDSCGLIVEYNPFHNGHQYHINQARNVSNSTCIIAIMSGNFLQRGEPAIIDKFHRTKAALHGGADIVIELPYTFAVQNSDRFAIGAIQTLNKFGVSSVCFGSESGSMDPFFQAYKTIKNSSEAFDNLLKDNLSDGLSFPDAATAVYETLGLTEGNLDLSKPNNILGFSYVKAIQEYAPTIKPLTIQRKNNDFHDESINGSIASATSIRKQILQSDSMDDDVHNAIPIETLHQLQSYKDKTAIWHDFEQYFPLLRYRVLTMSIRELQNIQGVVEGLEYRIQQSASDALSFVDWMHKIKTKRYTWTRIQRIFIHILTNTKKDENYVDESPSYIRILGMNKQGQQYLNYHKKNFDVPIITSIANTTHSMLAIEERATKAYYSIIPAKLQRKMFKQELQGPIII
ncbi:nucleotidyltransferase [Oceanobacillus iheyensis]|uniref:nucleotidyltransferase n=1 Tax=Oceanobacillus iheyensis TaxID=182710 RepID=UPI00363D41D6